MASQVDNILRGFLIPDPVFTLASLIKTGSPLPFTERAPRPPAVIAHSDPLSELAMGLTGEQDQNWQFRVQQPGFTKLGQCGIAYRKDTETLEEDYVGWNAPNAIRENIGVFQDSGVLPQVGAVTYPGTEDFLVLWSQGFTGLSARYRDVSLYEWEPAGPTNTSTDVSTEIGASFDPGGFPAPVILDSGRVLIFTKRDVANGQMQAMFYDRDTDNWSVYGTDVLESVRVIVELERMVAAESNGNVVVFWKEKGGAFDPSIHQFASNNLGTSFTFVQETDFSSGLGSSATAGISADIEVVTLKSGRFLFIYRDENDRLAARRLTTPFDAVGDQAKQVISATAVLEGMTAYVDADGVVYVYALGKTAPTAQTERIHAYMSTDEGETWREFGNDGTTGPTTLDDAIIMHPLAATRSLGRGILFVGDRVGGGSAPNPGSISALALGGWDSVEWKAFGGGILTEFFNGRETWDFGWRPQDVPDILAQYTKTGTGVSVIDSDFAGTYRCETDGSTNECFQTIALSGNQAFGNEVCVGVDAGALGARSGFIRASHRSDITNNYELVIRLTTTGFRVRDIGGAVDVVDKTGLVITKTDPMVFRVLLDPLNDKSRVLYRKPGETKWNHITFTLTGVAGGTATNEFEWGCALAGGVATSMRSFWANHGNNVAKWGFGFLHGEEPAPGAVGEFVWFDLIGRPLLIDPYPMGDSASNGAGYVFGKDGPGRAQEMQIATKAHDFGIDRAFPVISPSPSETWETTDTSEAILEWDFTHEKTIGGTTSGAMLFANVNYRHANFEFWNGSLWQIVGQVDTSKGFAGLGFVRNGFEVKASASGGGNASRYIKRNELAGGYFIFAAGGDVRKIVSNTEGVWTVGAATANKLAVLTLEGITGGELLTGTAGRILAPSAVLVFHDVVPATKYRLRILGAQDTAEGRYITGGLLVGGLALPGRQWSKGYSQEATSNAEITKDPFGTTRGRELGPVARSWFMSWIDPVSMREHQALNDPRFFADDRGPNPIGVYGDVYDVLAGMLEDLKSGEVPCVVIADIPTKDTLIFATINDPALFLYSRPISNSIRKEHLLGDEGQDEIVRIQQTAWEEVV